ncbi:MAG TPA: extracellular solute-binding protein [Tepidisphaeraceae bacterium]|nr:extracellular solute-binding protein [Tepidisphaeraceae bacterium]
MTHAITRFVVGFGLLVGVLSCDRDGGAGGGKGEVVLYTAIDEQVARPIVAEFEKRTGIKVKLKTDTEASKTSGLVTLLRAEQKNPQADVFWNNEVFHSINLAGEGVLASYESPSAKDLPAGFRDAGNKWAACGLRIRVIATAPGVSGVETMEDLADPTKVGKGKGCMAFPALGTVSGHLAALRQQWGAKKYEAWLKGLEAQEVKLLGGNSEVVKQISQGNMLAGPTDNDDVEAMIREDGPGKVRAAPAKTKEKGTLTIPTTVGLVAGAKHDAEAKRLIDYLLSAEVENKLVEAKFAIRPARGAEAEWDYVEVAKVMKEAVDKAREVLEGKK